MGHGGAHASGTIRPQRHHRPMPSRSRFSSAVVGGSPDEVETAFYEALRGGDIERLMACWADEDEVVCVHPGGGRIVGAAAIRASFAAMFANGTIRAWPRRARRVHALASAVHNVLERLEVTTDDGEREAWVIATNTYHKTAQGWRMVGHHASPATLQEVQEGQDAPQVLH